MAVYTNVFLAEEEFKDLHYLGAKHAELEVNHMHPDKLVQMRQPS